MDKSRVKIEGVVPGKQWEETHAEQKVIWGMPDKMLGLDAELRFIDRIDHINNRFLNDNVVMVVVMMIISIFLSTRW